MELHNCEHTIQFDLGCLQEVSKHEPRLHNGMKFFLELNSYFGTNVFSLKHSQELKMVQNTYYVYMCL